MKQKQYWIFKQWVLHRAGPPAAMVQLSLPLFVADAFYSNFTQWQRNIIPICSGSVTLLIGPILQALWAFRDLMTMVEWWDESREIICLILWNVFTSAPIKPKGQKMEIKWFFSKRVGQGESRQQSKHLYFLVGSPNTRQKIKMGLLERSKIFMANCNSGFWMCGGHVQFSASPESVVQCFDGRNGTAVW